MKNNEHDSDCQGENGSTFEGRVHLLKSLLLPMVNALLFIHLSLYSLQGEAKEYLTRNFYFGSKQIEFVSGSAAIIGRIVAGIFGSTLMKAQSWLLVSSAIVVAGSVLECTSGFFNDESQTAMVLVTLGHLTCLFGTGFGIHIGLYIIVQIFHPYIEKRVGNDSCHEFPDFQDMTFVRYVAVYEILLGFGRFFIPKVPLYPPTNTFPCMGYYVDCLPFYFSLKILFASIPGGIAYLWPFHIPYPIPVISWETYKDLVCCAYSMSLKKPLVMLFARRINRNAICFSNLDSEALTGFSPGQIQTVHAVKGLILLMPFFTMASIMSSSSDLLHYNLQLMNTTVNASFCIDMRNPPVLLLKNLLCPIVVSFWMIPSIRAMKLREPLSEFQLAFFVGVMYSVILSWSTLLITFVHGDGLSFPEGRDGQVIALNAMDCHVSLLIRNLSEPGFEKQIRVQPDSIFGVDVTEGNIYEFQGFASSCPEFKRLGNRVHGWSNILQEQIDQHQISSVLMVSTVDHTPEMFLLPQYSFEHLPIGIALIMIVIVPPGNSIPTGIVKHVWNEVVVANFSEDLELEEKIFLGETYIDGYSGRFDIFVDGIRLKTSAFYAGGSYLLLVRYVGDAGSQNSSKYVVSVFQDRPPNEHDIFFYIVGVLLLSLHQTLLTYLLQEFAVCEVPSELRCLSLALVPYIPLALPSLVHERILEGFFTMHPSTSDYWILCLTESGIVILGMISIAWMRKHYVYYGVRIQADKYTHVASA